MTLTHVISVGGDRLFSGPAEEATQFMQTHAFADRCVRDDGVLLATAVPYSTALLWSMNGDAGKVRQP